MSWSITASGSAEEIGKKFDTERERSAVAGMIELEQRDIDEARDFAMQFASAYGVVAVSANGHWTQSDQRASVHQFGRVSITIDKVADAPKG